MDGSKVSIEMLPGIAVQGVKILVDGVQPKAVRRATLVLEAGDVAKLTLETFSEVVFNGEAQVEIVHVCPQCLNEVRKSATKDCHAAVEVTGLSDEWRRYVPAARGEADV